MSSFIIVLIFFILLTITIAVLECRKKKNDENVKESLWLELVNDFKSKSQTFRTLEHLENYLIGIDDKIREYETDYSFLVAFNSIKREVANRLQIKI